MPLTDRRIFDIASRMPARYKVGEEQNKVALRTAAARVLPEEVAFRKKLGFVVPIRVWLKQDAYYNKVKEAFLSAAAQQFFNTDYLVSLLDEHKAGKKDNSRKIWTVYMFLVWYGVYFAD